LHFGANLGFISAPTTAPKAGRVIPISPVVSRSAALLVLASLAAGCSAPPQPRRDTLTVLLASDILSLDPNREIEQVTDSVLANVFEPLVGFDQELEARTVLAESWEHPSPERWRLNLRGGVTFHDGAPLTPELVRDALRRLKDGPSEEAAQFLSEVREIDVGPGNSVDIVTAQPRAILASLPGLYITKPNSASDFPPLVGTGPYRLVEWKAEQQVVLERWPGYRGPAPVFRRVVFAPVPDGTERVARLADGRADIAYEVPPQAGPREPPGVRFLTRPGITVFYLGFNLRDVPTNPFRHLRVRQALHLAIDREQLLERGLMGQGAVATQPVAPAVFGYDPDVPRPRYEPLRARGLLQEAGYPRGFRARLDLSAARLPVARVLQEQLRAVGVALDLNPLEQDGVHELASAGKSDLFLVGWDCSTGEASEFYEFCLHTPAGQYGKGNYGRYSNPTVDEIAETNGAILDQRLRRRLLQKAAVIAMEDLPVLPLWVHDDVYGVRADLTFRLRADATIRLADVRWAESR
jgi:peptide/nickel transport system substrate-binding protein